MTVRGGDAGVSKRAEGQGAGGGARLCAVERGVCGAGGSGSLAEHHAAVASGSAGLCVRRPQAAAMAMGYVGDGMGQMGRASGVRNERTAQRRAQDVKCTTRRYHDRQSPMKNLEVKFSLPRLEFRCKNMF